MSDCVRVNDEVELIRLNTLEAIQRWRSGFIGVYQTVFQDEPYFERITTVEAEGVFRKLTSTPGQVTIVAIQQQSQVVGFSAMIPIKHRNDVMVELAGLVPLHSTYYFAELGVLPEYRGRQLGRALIRERLRILHEEFPHITHVVLRVAARKNASYDMYLEMGFEDMGVYMEVPAVRMDGRVNTDRRLILCCVISQIRKG